MDEVGANKPNYKPMVQSLYPSKSRAALIGSVGAGKSAVAAGLKMAAETKVAVEEDYYCRVIEGRSEIHQDAADLRDGHFPRKTKAFNSFAAEAGLLNTWEKKIKVLGREKVIWRKQLQVPICDVAGEDLQQTIRQVRAQGALGENAKQNVRNLISYVRESDVLMVICKATRAKGLFPRGKQLEFEQDRKLSDDPDVNLVRMLEDLINYKENYRSRPLKGLCVIITAWDQLKHSGVADKLGFDLLRKDIGQNDLVHFVQACFPAVYAVIKSARVQNVI